MSDVFVSYKAEDRRRVKPLVEALEAEGYSVWWDEQIGGGAAWRQTIEAELNAAQCVLVAWSKRSVGPEGTFVQDEATRAQQRRVYVPVTIDKVHLPLGFGETQALPLSGWKGDRSDPRYQAVLSAVQRLVGERRAERPIPSRAISRRAAVAGGAAAAVAAAGVGTWALLRPDKASAADSIAVLPFANLSGDPAQDYFSDGIAEELRSALARLAGMKVVGRTSSEAVRTADAETAARKLGVSNILTGSVRRSPETIRVSAQLVDGGSGLEKWSSSYDRAPGDTIKIQTDIAENVARALSVALGAAAQAALTVGGTDSAAAQNLIFQANEISYEGTLESIKRAIELIDAALALDPDYAAAYGLKAILLLVQVNRYARGSEQLAPGRAEALRNARKALAIAPNLPIGHGALAGIYASQLQVRPALAEHERAHALASGDPDAGRSFASFLSRMGDAPRALRLADQAAALDPLNSVSYGTRARVLFNARRYQEGASSLEELKRRSPQLFSSWLTLADCLMMIGRTDAAAKAYAEIDEADPFRLLGEAVLGVRTGDRQSAMQKTAQLQRLYGDAASYQYADIFAQLGEPEEALKHLERAWQIKDGGLLSLKVDPWVDPLRREPRFVELMRRMNWPD